MKKTVFLSMFLALMSLAVPAQVASVKLDAQNPHQHITGFGGFVCSPQFAYNHMSTADIKKVWGTGSTVGCNIMRLIIPVGSGSWGSSLQTAKLAKQLGLTLFASPWGQPANWKTNNSSVAKTSDGKEGKLKRENWPDYAKYLDDYVKYLRNNGVELDAISIQNEPNWPCTYDGCLWSASEMAEFVKTYGRTISCKIITPETIGVSDDYVNALNNDNVLNSFDIYGGHQYGGIQPGYKQLGQKGKELWMTEYLINWNENKADSEKRNYSFSSDFFDFFRAINTCMLGDFNAWIHYAAKRYYGMLGDGTFGTTTGVVTKRGYIMAHYARFVTGMTRIDAIWNDIAAQQLEGSAYLSQTGDSIVAVIANTSDKVCQLTLDLPFYTQKGFLYTTTQTTSFQKKTLSYDEQLCRPVADIPAKCVATVLFVRSADRQVSFMKGSKTHFDRLDDMKTTNEKFGETYKLSGQTKTFDASNPLISTRKAVGLGYIELPDRYSQLVMHIDRVTTTNALTVGSPLLYYVNAKGKAVSHSYDRIDLSRQQNFDMVLDLSPNTLTDGCIGLLSFTCDNSSSHLTITFGDVYLSSGVAQSKATLSGPYVADDSNVLDFSADATCTSLDMTTVTELPSVLPWLDGTNRVVYVAEGSPLTASNVVVGDVCQQLSLTSAGGDFRSATGFTAQDASFTCDVNGLRLLVLPFEAAVPQGALAYTLADDLSPQPVQTIPAHQPVLLEANGSLTLKGSGLVNYAVSPVTSVVRGTYTTVPLYAGDYVLDQQDGQWGLRRLTSASSLQPFGVYARPSSTEAFIPLGITAAGIADIQHSTPTNQHSIYNLMGQRVGQHHHGIVILNGQKFFMR
ncbi:MAG: hypothetical protein IKQ05_06180 [Prevotella sp.]|nr:hypothetical protein [Prevotella sp.]